MAPSDFLHAHVPSLGRDVHRVGLALNYGVDPDGVRLAFDRGVQLVFWTPMRTSRVTPVVREALARDRARYVVSAGPSMGFFAGSVRRGLERALRALGTDYIDVLNLFWVGVGSAITDATLGELLRLKEEGRVKAIGISIHDRARAGRLVRESPIDVFMLRYNAAHPGAERDVFPTSRAVAPLSSRTPRLRGASSSRHRANGRGAVPTAADCYRFCLSSPHVDVVLTGPKSRAELEENLDGLARGPLTPDEESLDARLRRGRARLNCRRTNVGVRASRRRSARHASSALAAKSASIANGSVGCSASAATASAIARRDARGGTLSIAHRAPSSRPHARPLSTTTCELPSAIATRMFAGFTSDTARIAKATRSKRSVDVSDAEKSRSGAMSRTRVGTSEE